MSEYTAGFRKPGEPMQKIPGADQLATAKYQIATLEAKLAATAPEGGEEIMESQTAVPGWKDPYTNNGDRRPDTDYRHGWNDCRVAMLDIIKEQGK